MDDWAKPDFEKIAEITGGTCEYLDVNNEQLGQKLLINKLSPKILEMIGEKKQKGLGKKMASSFVMRFN